MKRRILNLAMAVTAIALSAPATLLAQDGFNFCGWQPLHAGMMMIPAALAGGMEALLSGTTTLIDHHASPNAIDGSLDLVADALTELGLRSVCCYEVSDRDGPERARAAELCSLTLTTTGEGTTVRRPSVTRPGRIAVLALPSIIVLAATGVTTGVAAAVQEQSIRASVVDQVSGVASNLADLPEVRAAVASVVDTGAPGALADADGLASATASLQPIASLVEGASGVSYVVVTDDEGVRITHPDPSERGALVETTIAPVLAGERFVGTETGPSGSVSDTAPCCVRSAAGYAFATLPLLTPSRMSSSWRKVASDAATNCGL